MFFCEARTAHGHTGLCQGCGDPGPDLCTRLSCLLNPPSHLWGWSGFYILVLGPDLPFFFLCTLCMESEVSRYLSVILPNVVLGIYLIIVQSKPTGRMCTAWNFQWTHSYFYNPCQETEQLSPQGAPPLVPLTVTTHSLSINNLIQTFELYINGILQYNESSFGGLVLFKIKFWGCIHFIENYSSLWFFIDCLPSYV